MRPPLTAVLAATLGVLTVSGCATVASGSPLPNPPASSAAVEASAALGAAPVPTTPSPTTPPAAGLGSPSALATSPGPSPSPTPSFSNPVTPSLAAGPPPAGTFVLGDSIILGAGVGPRLASFGYAVVGVVGQSATEEYLRTNLSSPLAQSSHSWVIELGTNNSGDPYDVARLGRLVDVIDGLRTEGRKQKVYWVTPYRPSTYIGTKTRYTLDAFTAELARLAQDRRWLRFIDWAAVARLHEEWFASDSMHLHPDATGQAVLLSLIAGPDATPVAVPSPLLTALPTPEPSPEPETFDNSTMPPTPAPIDPPPTALTPSASPVPASGVAVSAPAQAATTDAATPGG